MKRHFFADFGIECGEVVEFPYPTDYISAICQEYLVEHYMHALSQAGGNLA